jgi:hypothetical protein
MPPFASALSSFTHDKVGIIATVVFIVNDAVVNVVSNSIE